MTDFHTPLITHDLFATTVRANAVAMLNEVSPVKGGWDEASDTQLLFGIANAFQHFRLTLIEVSNKNSLLLRKLCELNDIDPVEYVEAHYQGPITEGDDVSLN